MRDLVSLLIVGTLLSLLAGFAWLTRHPESKLLEHAQEWPLVGPMAERFRRAYLPSRSASALPSPGEDSEGERATIVVQELDEDWIGALPEVWLEPDTPIRDRPDAGARVLHTVRAHANVGVLERRGAWCRIRYRAPAGRLKGWVRVDEPEPAEPWLGRDPAPVLPLAASPPNRERLMAARALLADGGRRGRCGPYDLWTDVENPPHLSACNSLATALEPVYEERYGLQPVGEPAEAILLFRRAEDYALFHAQEGMEIGSAGHALPARGYVALYVAGRGRAEFAATLVHELTHLLNRRAIGPALPPWLDEGIADDLADSPIGSDGRLRPGRLGGELEHLVDRLVLRGGQTSGLVLQGAYERQEARPLEELLDLDRDQFQDPAHSRLHYAQSSALVRYLLSGRKPGLTVGFRAFLAAVAAGGPATRDALLDHLGTGWPELEGGMLVWVKLQAPPEAGVSATEASQAEPGGEPPG